MWAPYCVVAHIISELPAHIQKNRHTVRCRWMPVYALSAQRKSPMRISVHIGHLKTPILSGIAANRVLCMTPFLHPLWVCGVSHLAPCPCGLHRDLPFYPIRFLTGNPARRCVVFLPLARFLKLKSWQASPKKYLIGWSFTFTPGADTPEVQRKTYKWNPISFEKAC